MTVFLSILLYVFVGIMWVSGFIWMVETFNSPKSLQGIYYPLWLVGAPLILFILACIGLTTKFMKYATSDIL